ncbi:MAG: hypothetical protein U1F43_31185 [Myxococcota bacterium]
MAVAGAGAAATDAAGRAGAGARSDRRRGGARHRADRVGQVGATRLDVDRSVLQLGQRVLGPGALGLVAVELGLERLALRLVLGEPLLGGRGEVGPAVVLGLGDDRLDLADHAVLGAEQRRQLDGARVQGRDVGLDHFRRSAYLARQRGQRRLRVGSLRQDVVEVGVQEALGQLPIHFHHTLSRFCARRGYTREPSWTPASKPPSRRPCRRSATASPSWR